MAWELIFMLVILKIPVVYLCCVVWWAIKAEPKPLDGAAVVAPDDVPGPGPAPWWRRHALRPRRPRGGPHGAPLRRYPRAGLASARARAGLER